MRRRGRVKRPAVVGAIIDPGVCLNLLDRNHLELVGRAYVDLVKTSADAGRPLPLNVRLPHRRDLLLRRLDCAVINACRASRLRDVNFPPFDSVRPAFVEGEPLYPNAGFNDRNHIQLCVVNQRCIQGYFRPLTGGPA